jgi:hypothetical protein
MEAIDGAKCAPAAEIGMHEVDDGLRVKSVSGDSLVLTGVHRKFAEAVVPVANPVP